MSELRVISFCEAKGNAMKRYFTGKPCKNGHISERSVSSRRCIECHREESIARYAKNTDRERDRSAKYHSANKLRRREVRASHYQSNRDRILQKNNAWMAENRERFREYLLANSDKVREYASKYRAQKIRATPPWLSEKDREAIAAIYAEAVRLEKETRIPHEVDHIVPLRGDLVCGLHIPINLQILTKDENLKKSNQWKEVWE